MPKSLTSDAIRLLSNAVIDGNFVQFPQVDYAIYQRVKPVMEALNAPWSRKYKAHVFAEDVDPYALIQSVLIAGTMPEQNPLAYFPTEAPVARTMLAKASELLVSLGLDVFTCRWLEPSAGEGAIAQQILKLLENPLSLRLIELDIHRFNKLKSAGYEVEQGDFLKMLPGSDQRYHCIVMNPPFAVAGQPKAYIDHVLHAYEQWLACPGALVAIAPGGFACNHDSRTEAFRTLVERHGGWCRLPDDSFKSAGTSVTTVMLWLRKK